MSADGLLVWCDPEPHRVRLPNRRECFTETIEIGGRCYSASVGFNERDEPKEIFLAGAKSGSDMDDNLADAAIVVSRTLQLGVKAQHLTGEAGRPNSAVGAALDLLARYEAEDWR
jgi:hypothetical protein